MSSLKQLQGAADFIVACNLKADIISLNARRNAAMSYVDTISASIEAHLLTAQIDALKDLDQTLVERMKKEETEGKSWFRRK